MAVSYLGSTRNIPLLYDQILTTRCKVVLQGGIPLQTKWP